MLDSLNAFGVQRWFVWIVSLKLSKYENKTKVCLKTNDTIRKLKESHSTRLRAQRHFGSYRRFKISRPRRFSSPPTSVDLLLSGFNCSKMLRNSLSFERFLRATRACNKLYKVDWHFHLLTGSSRVIMKRQRDASVRPKFNQEST